MSDSVFRAAKGAQYSHTDAQAIGEHLQHNGIWTPEKVLVDAEQPDSPLRNFFEWDNSTAAYQWRLSQARQLLNHLEIEVVIDGKVERTKAFHHLQIVTEDDPASEDSSHFGYVRLDVALSDQAYADQIIAKALREIQGWQRRYREYQSVFGRVFEAVDALM